MTRRIFFALVASSISLWLLWPSSPQEGSPSLSALPAPTGQALGVEPELPESPMNHESIHFSQERATIDGGLSAEPAGPSWVDLGARLAAFDDLPQLVDRAHALPDCGACTFRMSLQEAEEMVRNVRRLKMELEIRPPESSAPTIQDFIRPSGPIRRILDDRQIAFLLENDLLSTSSLTLEVDDLYERPAEAAELVVGNDPDEHGGALFPAPYGEH